MFVKNAELGLTVLSDGTGIICTEGTGIMYPDGAVSELISASEFHFRAKRQPVAFIIGGSYSVIETLEINLHILVQII